jgi:hypothetical protein
MQILKQKQSGLAVVMACPRLSHGTGRRIEEERSIVRLAVVIAGKAKTARRRRYAESGRSTT